MKNYSYITYLTNDSYVYGITLLVKSMEMVNTKYPLHVLINDEVSAPTIEILNQLGVTYELVENIPTPEGIYKHNLDFQAATASTWRNCWTQFRVFDLTQFNKIVFLDADVMIMKNLDHLFEKPHLTAPLDGEYFNIWPNWPHFNTGCMVIEPSHEEFENILNYANSLKVEELPIHIIANQEVLNMYYNDWPEKEELHLNKYYSIFAPYVMEEDIEDLDENTYFVHYVGRKPWTNWYKLHTETYSEHYYTMARELVDEKIKTFDWNKIREKVTITVYGICKNEIQSVNNYLNSFIEADYVCLLDTGSTDGTWEFLQKKSEQYPNLIIDQKEIKPWRFDTARNKSMELIPKETVVYFMVDLDEVIKEKGWTQKIREVWTPLFGRGMYKYNRDVDKNDVVERQINEYRLHNKEWTHWENIVHEALINVAGERKFYVEDCTKVDIVVWHYPTKTGKTNYMELCEEDLKENPNNWIMHLQLAIEYEVNSEWDKAFSHFEYIVTHDNNLQFSEKARCYFGMGRIQSIKGNPDMALFYYSEGRLINHTFIDNYIAAAEVYYNMKEYQKTIDLCLEGLKNCHDTTWCSFFDPNSYYPYWLLGMSYYFLGQKDKALGYITIYNIKNPIEEAKRLRQTIAFEIIEDWRR